MTDTTSVPVVAASGSTLGWPVPPTIFVDLPGGGHDNGWAAWCARIGDWPADAVCVNAPIGGIRSARRTLAAAERIVAGVVDMWDRLLADDTVWSTAGVGRPDGFIVGVEGVVEPKSRFMRDRIAPMFDLLDEVCAAFPGCRVIPPAALASRHLRRNGGTGEPADYYHRDVYGPCPPRFVNEHPENRMDHIRTAWVGAAHAARVPRPQAVR